MERARNVVVGILCFTLMNFLNKYFDRLPIFLNLIIFLFLLLFIGIEKIKKEIKSLYLFTFLLFYITIFVFSMYLFFSKELPYYYNVAKIKKEIKETEKLLLYKNNVYIEDMTNLKEDILNELNLINTIKTEKYFIVDEKKKYEMKNKNKETLFIFYYEGNKTLNIVLNKNYNYRLKINEFNLESLKNYIE